MDHETPTPDPPPVMQVEHDQFCVGCSYNLRGLPVSGRCPECGASVERSLRGDLLEYSSPDYLGALSRGLQIIVWGTIAQLLLMILLALGMIAVVIANQGTPVPGGELLLGWIAVLFSLAIMYGWYVFSTPDPAIVGSDKGDTPRRIVRIAAIASTVLSASAAVVATIPTGSADPTMPVAQEITAGSADMLAGVAGIVLYFASLVYVRWIAKRVPDPRLDADAKRLMWLGPVLFVVLFCTVVGPIVAYILYLMLLFQARKLIDVIHENQAPLYAA